MAAVCAAAISFSALCAGFGENFTKAQDDLMNKVSNREIWVVNATAPGHVKGEYYSLPSDLAFTEKDLANFEKISELEGVYPYFEFNSALYVEGQTEEKTRTVSVTDQDGETERIAFDPNETNDSYTIVPYLPDQLMDQKSEKLDESVEDGVYLSASMAELLGIKSPEGVSLAADALVPVKLKEMDFPGEGGEIVKGDLDVCVLDFIGGKVRGILENQVKNSYSQSSENIIYIPYDRMEALLDSQKETELNQGESVWRPSACIMSASSYHAVESAKEKLSRMNSSFLVYNRYQDFESMNASIQSIRDMTFIVSIVILVIIFLLMAVVYMNYVEGRKFEFSILKANGITRKEIRRLVYLESLIQVIKTAVLALAFAGVLALITNLLVFGNEMISYNLELVLTVAGISLLSIILPAVITLTFVNRYDPDRVMRN